MPWSWWQRQPSRAKNRPLICMLDLGFDFLPWKEIFHTDIAISFFNFSFIFLLKKNLTVCLVYTVNPSQFLSLNTVGWEAGFCLPFFLAFWVSALRRCLPCSEHTSCFFWENFDVFNVYMVNSDVWRETHSAFQRIKCTFMMMSINSSWQSKFWFYFRWCSTCNFRELLLLRHLLCLVCYCPGLQLGFLIPVSSKMF